MTMQQIPARDIIVQVEDSSPGTWIDVGGLTQVGVTPGQNEQAEDTTTYDSTGDYEQIVMQRGAQLTLTGKMLKDDTSGAQDTGQARCEDLAAQVGYASRGRVRFRHPADTLWKLWTATCSLGEQAGGNNNTTGWSCTVTKSGASSTMAAS